MNNIIEFIKRRFPNDSNWLNGNCFYFAIILKSHFPEGVIFYDVVIGHFVFMYENIYYDWSGKIEPDLSHLVEWDKFDEYDSLQKERIIEGCVL